MKCAGMYLAIISWQSCAAIILSGCILYYTILILKYRFFKGILRIRSAKVSESILRKMEGDELAQNDNGNSKHSKIVHDQTAANAARFHNLTDELNALLLQAAASKLSREVLLLSIQRLIKGYDFGTNHAEIINAIKEIVIDRALAICQIAYTIDELTEK